VTDDLTYSDTRDGLERAVQALFWLCKLLIYFLLEGL
jgi:hypothetical protein